MTIPNSCEQKCKIYMLANKTRKHCHRHLSSTITPSENHLNRNVKSMYMPTDTRIVTTIFAA